MKIRSNAPKYGSTSGSSASVGRVAAFSPAHSPPGRSLDATAACAAKTVSTVSSTWLVFSRIASHRWVRASNNCQPSKGNPRSATSEATIVATQLHSSSDMLLAHAKLNLNGSYLLQLELDRTEIARLFYETNGRPRVPRDTKRPKPQ